VEDRIHRAGPVSPPAPFSPSPIGSFLGKVLVPSLHPSSTQRSGETSTGISSCCVQLALAQIARYHSLAYMLVTFVKPGSCFLVGHHYRALVIPNFGVAFPTFRDQNPQYPRSTPGDRDSTCCDQTAAGCKACDECNLIPLYRRISRNGERAKATRGPRPIRIVVLEPP
jgi:hypothetical protein